MMNTAYRDDAIKKNRLLLKLLLIWALSSTLAVIILSVLNTYSLLHRQVHWLPVCVDKFSLGDREYSPNYLKEMTKKVADLRLTYNPETIDARLTMLSHLIAINKQEIFLRLLDSERKTIHEKNISSVFYDEKISVDVSKNQGQIEGLLYRTSHGLSLKPQHKIYRIQFSFTNGLLSLQSIREMSHA